MFPTATVIITIFIKSLVYSLVVTMEIVGVFCVEHFNQSRASIFIVLVIVLVIRACVTGPLLQLQERSSSRLAQGWISQRVKT